LIQENCWDAHASGPGCRAVYNHDDDVSSIPALTDASYFFLVTGVTEDTPLRVSVRENNPADTSKRPRLFASRGNAPQLNSAEIIDCNIDTCGAARIIERTPPGGATEVWFIGVQGVPGGNATDFAIWFDSVCAFPCDRKGKCTMSPSPNEGLCVCHSKDDSGAACQNSQSVSQQYIVLAAIWAAALGATIFVLVAYFFTQNKQTYERLA
jgi:hypothetical protein